MLVLVCILCILLSIALFFSLRLNLRCYEKIQSVAEQVEKSLDVLDTCYQRADSRAKLEVFSDDPIVKELVDDIRITRDSILLVANLIIEPYQENNNVGDNGQNVN